MKVYFEVKRWSRLGNWMFQYAAAKSLSKDVACLVEHEELIPLMRKEVWFRDLEYVTSAPDGSFVYEEKTFAYQPILYPRGTTNLVIKGWFQTQKYFDEDVVRRLFAPGEELRGRLMSKYADELRHPEVTSIHVRRGDYLKYPESFPFVGRGYLRDAVARVINRTGTRDMPFVVLSDDIPWCRTFFTGRSFKGLRFRFSDANSPVEDMVLASLCKNNIISNSSFGWWGAWLNAHPGKKVFAPSPWLGIIFAKENAAREADMFNAVEFVRVRHLWLRNLKGWLNWRRKTLRICLGAFRRKSFA